MNISLPTLSGFLELLTIGREQVCRKYPVHKIPRRGEKLILNITKILSLSYQSVAFDSAVEPKLNLVSVNAITPVAMIKIIRSTTKITPNDPILMKMLMSFLLQIITKTTNKTSDT